MGGILIKKDSMESTKSKKILKISWSKLNQYFACPASWFCINYAEIIDVEQVQTNQTKAIPGTIVQKLFEVFINERVYKRPEMNSYDDIINWFQKNSRALFKLIARPLEDQYLFEYKNPRYFFKRKAGEKCIDEVRRVHKLDPCITPPQIAFIDWSMLEEDFGSSGISGEEGFLNHLDSLYGPIIDLIVENEINLNFMYSEAYIEAKLNKITLNGFIDFIYNKNQSGGTLYSLNQLSEGFLVLDGKIRLSRYVSKEQLHYYATLLYLKYKKRPSHIGFLDWSTPKFAMYEFNPNYITTLKSKIVKIQNSYLRIKEFLSGYKEDSIPLENLDLDYNPNPICMYCPIFKICVPALERREEIEKFATAIENKKQTKKYLKEMNLDPDLPTQDIKL